MVRRERKMTRYLMVLVIILVVFFSLTSDLAALDFFELCRTGTPEEAKRAIESGAEVNLAERLYSYSPHLSPLIEAARYNPNPEVLKILL